MTNQERIRDNDGTVRQRSVVIKSLIVMPDYTRYIFPYSVNN